MATKSKDKSKKAESKKTSTNGRKAVENRMSKSFRAEKATFGHDDKRAQYARLVIFNFGVKEGIIKKDEDINSATINSKLEKAGLALIGGNLLDGPESLEVISDLTKKGSTTGKPLTKAYSAEVRPFVKRLQMADKFGNRHKKREKKEKAAEEVPAAEEASAAV